MRNHYALSLLAASLLAAGAPLAQPAFSLVSANFPAQRGHAAVAPADYDGDGDFDLLAIRQAVYSVDPMMRPVLYRNDSVSTAGVFLFTEVPFPASPYPAQETTADPDGETVSWSDYDNDGDVDALVATPFYSGIYRNDDSTFVEAVVLPPYSEFIGGAFDSRSAVWTDYDNDGDGDLFLSERFEAEITVDSTRLVLYRNDAGSFTPADTTFPFYAGALHLTTGDLEGDGDLDLLYHDVGWHCGGPVGPPEGEECVVFYENANGAFVPDSLSFPIAIHGSASDLADYDGDGDLDMLLVTELGRDQYPPDPYSAALLYRNEDGVFIADTLEFEISGEREFNRTKGAAWADYDDDGDLDAVVVGTVMPGQDGLAILFANTNGTLTHTAEIPTVDFFGTVAWFDLDGDGDLDYLTSGYLSGPTHNFTTWLYRNNASGSNAAPSPPQNPEASPTSSGVTLTWAPAADDHTPASALSYNIHVRSLSGSDIVSPQAHPSGNGGRLLPEPGNVSLNLDWTLEGLAEGTYEWWVQAIDNAFNGGPFAAGGTFTVGTPTDVGDDLPSGFAVSGVYPNPTHSAEAVVRVDLPAPAEVRVRLFDVLGREVVTLAPHLVEAGASRSIALPVIALPSGVYVYRVEASWAGTHHQASGLLTRVR